MSDLKHVGASCDRSWSPEALSTSLNSLALKSLDVFEYLSDAVSSKTRRRHVVMVTRLHRKFLCDHKPLKPFLEPVILIAGSRGPPRWPRGLLVRKFSQESDSFHQEVRGDCVTTGGRSVALHLSTVGTAACPGLVWWMFVGLGTGLTPLNMHPLNMSPVYAWIVHFYESILCSTD